MDSVLLVENNIIRSDWEAGQGHLVEAILSYLKKSGCHLLLGEMALDMFHSLFGERLRKNNRRREGRKTS